MDILFAVRTASQRFAAGLARVTVEVTYSKNNPGEDDDKEPVLQSTRVELDAELNGSSRLEQAASPVLEASVLAADGSAVITRSITASEDGTAVLTLSKEDVQTIADHPQAVPADPAVRVVTRKARLVPTGSAKIDAARANVVVVPIADPAALAAAGVDAVLGGAGSRIVSGEVTPATLAVLGHFAWTPTHLAVDGTFTAMFLQQQSIGWLWWLIGEQQAFGFFPDNLEVDDTRTFTIALPPLTAPRQPATPAPPAGCGRDVPANVTESELANNPGIYSEDPGAFCRPFSNPERVLSEKAFAVIARVTQPEIGPLGSVKTKTMTFLNLEGDVASAAVRTTGLALPAFVATAPARHKLVTRYADLLKRLPSGRTTMDARRPVQWEDDIAQYQAATVALGHILEFRVRWRSNGYSLGTVAKTLTLAPRQTRRIQKIEWARNERARRSESTQLRDQENDSVVRERNYDDSVAASLSEWSSGASSSDTEAIAGGIGFFAAGIIGGIGGGAASAHSSSHAEGGRDTTAQERQRLKDSIRRHGDALRKFESVVVNEVNQEETVTGTTEVIRNANYAHSLTVIYYQILRHLKVQTEFAGVRECLFIPFAIKPFDIQRAYRWRESLQAAMRTPRYSRALRYLKDVATGFTTSDIPPGPRAGQPLTYVRGSIYVNLGIERPRDGVDGVFDENGWRVLQPLLQTPALGIFSILFGHAAAQRDRVFQTEHAPAIAAQWADRITLRIGTRTLDVDCTLASRYQFNHSARIDFAVPAAALAGLSRQDLQQLTVAPGTGLPPGSVANLTRISLVYNTQRYEHAVDARTGTNDLVSPSSGNAGSATVVLPLDTWERVDERLEIRRGVEELIEHLNEHVEYYHKVIWWRMDRDRLMMMLDGFFVPNTNNVSIASVVDREPVGIIGNSIVYRVGAASFLGYGKVTTPAELYNVYADKQPMSDATLVSVPTDGLYAQAIMDECGALEEHFGNTDWVLNQQDPDLGTIDPSLLLTRRADQTAATTPTPFPATIINLQNAPDAPAPSGLQGVLNAVTNPNAFRDMAGLAGTQANALGALNTAAGLATNFGNQAAAIELAKLAKADQATRTADQKIASIQSAVNKGLSTPEDAAKATRDVLSAMNPDSPGAQAPHENAAINAAIEGVRSIPGSVIEASTPEGGVSVKVGGDSSADRLSRKFIVETPLTSSAENRSFNPRTHDKSGKITLTVKVPNLPSDHSVRWTVPPFERGHFTLAGGRDVQSGLRADVTGLQPGRTNIDVEVLNAAGAVVESQKYPLCIPQFVAVGIEDSFLTLMRGIGLDDSEIEDILGVTKSVADLVLSEANVRMVWNVAPLAGTPEKLPPQFAPGGPAQANVTRARFRGDPPEPTLAGLTSDRNGNSDAGALIGPTHFDERVDVFVGAFDDDVPSGASRDVDDVTKAVVQAIIAQGLTSSPSKSTAMSVLGRLYGETLAHEIAHSLIGPALSAVWHNSHPGLERDLLNFGSDRPFDTRTGFVVDVSQIGTVDIGTLLQTDRDIGAINIPTMDARIEIDATFPVPPVFQ